jgi:hypothetical protein
MSALHMPIGIRLSFVKDKILKKGEPGVRVCSSVYLAGLRRGKTGSSLRLELSLGCR